LQIECEIVTVHRYPPPRDIWFDSLDFKHFDISLHLSILAESAWPLTSIVILHSLTSGNMYDMQFCLSCLGFIRKNDWFDFFFFFQRHESFMHVRCDYLHRCDWKPYKSES